MPSRTLPKIAYNLDTRELVIDGVPMIWSFFNVEFSNLSKIGVFDGDIYIIVPMRDGNDLTTIPLTISNDKVTGVIDSHALDLLHRYDGDTGSRLLELCLTRNGVRVQTVRFRLFGNADAPTVTELLDQTGTTIATPQLEGVNTLAELRAINTGDHDRYKDKVQIFVEDVSANYAFNREDCLSVDDDDSIIVPTEGVGCWKRVGGAGNLSIEKIPGLPEALNAKASNSDLELKADASTVNALIITVNGKASTSDLELKADVSALNTLTGVVNSKADLVDGLIPANQLPGFVDDVIEVANDAALPATGEAGKIYVVLDTNKQKRWSGSVYVTLTGDIALGETAATAYRGDRGKTAFDHSQTTGNVHGVTASDVGNDTAQWNASKINGINTTVPTLVNQALVFDGTNYVPTKVRVDNLLTNTLVAGQQNVFVLGSSTAYKVWVKITDASGNYVTHSLEFTNNGVTGRVTAGQGNGEGTVANFTMSGISTDIFAGNQRMLLTLQAGTNCTLKHKIINEM